MHNINNYANLLPSDPEGKRHLLFVYGTLKKTGGNGAHERFLDRSTFVGRCSIAGVMVHLGGCPGLISDGLCRVTGEVYEVGPRDIQAMDAYEGTPHNFVRMLVTTPFGTAWTYYKNHITITDKTMCVDRGVWSGGELDRAPYSEVLDFFKGKKYLNPEERAKPDQPITYEVIPESSPARNPLTTIPPSLKPVLKVKPLVIGLGLGEM